MIGDRSIRYTVKIGHETDERRRFFTAATSGPRPSRGGAAVLRQKTGACRGIPMSEARTAEIAHVLADPDAATLSAEQWGAMYEKLWKELDKANAKIEHLQMQLMLHANTRWPN